MRVLTIETATQIETVALVEEGDVLAERSTRAGRGRADELIAAVDEVLAAAPGGLGGLDRLAVSIGPGRFTGLRVGLATAKGLAASTGLPLVPVPTLRALAVTAAALEPGGAAFVCTMLDARRGEVYAGLFSAGDRCPRALPDRAEAALSLLKRVLECSGEATVLFAGTGVSPYREEIENAAGVRARFSAVERPGPRAMALLARDASGDDLPDLASLKPVYLRGV